MPIRVLRTPPQQLEASGYNAQASKGVVHCRGVHNLTAGTNTGSCSLSGPSCSPPGLVGVHPEGASQSWAGTCSAKTEVPWSLQPDVHAEATWNCPVQVPVLWLVALEVLLELGEG